MITGVFTTIKIKDSTPLFFDKHKKRLFGNANSLKIKTPFSLDKKINSYLQKNNLIDCALRVTIIKNKGEVVLDNRQLPSSISSIPAITISDTRDKNKIYKTTSRKVNEQAKKFAEEKAAVDAIFINKGNLIESTISNIFSLNKKGELITPNLDNKGLKGVTRQIIMENAKVIEQGIPADTNAPLVLVNSLRIQKVDYLDGRKLESAEELFLKIKKILKQEEEKYLQKQYKIYYKKLSTWTDPELIFTKLFSRSSKSFWLDSSLINDTSHFSYMGTPTKIYSQILKNLRINNSNVFYIFRARISKK